MNWWALTFAILFVVLVVFVSIAMYWTVKWPNWSPSPYDGLNGVVQELGPPSSANYSAGGMAVWNAKRLDNEPWQRVIMRDEEIPNCCPEPTKDFLYVSLCLDLENALVESMVLSINEGIWYDSGKNRLWIRSNSLPSAVATALFVTQTLLSLKSADSFSDAYNQYWSDTDQIQADYAKLVSAVVGADDDDYQKYKTQLQANLNQLGCPALDDCDDPDCSNPWDPASIQSVMDSTGVNSIPPTSSDSDSTESFAYASKEVCGASNGCAVRNQTPAGYSLGPVKSSKSTLARVSENKHLQTQPFTLGMPVDTSLPKNYLSETRERYNHRILADTRQEVSDEKVGISRSQNSLNGLVNHNLLLARHESAGPLHHKNIEHAVQRHAAGEDQVEGYSSDWASNLTNGQCKTCNVKRNGRPMTISAV